MSDRRDRALDTVLLDEAGDGDVGRPIQFDRSNRRPELVIASHSVARAVSGVTAALIAAGSVSWVSEARDRFSVPDVYRPEWFRWIQVLIAAVGIAAAIVELAYLAHFARRGRVWRHWRIVTLVFGVLASVWTAVWLLDRFVLDGLFLD